MGILFGFAILVGVVATATDMRSRTIPNWIPVTALVGGLGLNGWLGGWPGVGSSCLGALIGFVLFYLRFRFFGMGGGDVKLMAGYGAILGSQHALLGVIFSAAFGGLVALGALVYWRMRQPDEVAAGAGPRPRLAIPYAPAIAMGCVFALIDRFPG